MGNSISSSVAGIGLNVNQERFFGDAPNPVSLKMITGKEHDAELLLEDLCKDIDLRYDMLIQGNRKKLSSDYINALYRFGLWNKFSDKDGEFTGMIEDVQPSGMLVVRNKEGRRKEYAFKEIRFII
jgi:BirA family transcriptional regulator, biotin operon repressor / biotin---[acetyl-CoA-carboxylase] ligase